MNQIKPDGSTPLYIAAQQGHGAVVGQLLAAEGISVNQAELGGATPLSVAALKGHGEVVGQLTANVSTVSTLRAEIASAKQCTDPRCDEVWG